MTLVLYHRTSMAEAHEVVRKGFEDLDWDFGLTDARTGEEAVVTGVWLSDRALSERDGIDGDALLQVEVDAREDELAPFALEGLLWDTKLWVVPSAWVNARCKVRFAEVDPRSSGLHPAIDFDDETPSGGDRG